MEPPFQIIFIILVILTVLSIWFLSVKYFLHPLLFKPNVNSTEVFDFLEEKNLVFVEKRGLNKTEIKLTPFNYEKGFSLKRMFSERTEYIVIGFSESRKEHHFFWLELTQWNFLLTQFFLETVICEKIEKRRNLVFKEITENQILTELKKVYESKTVLITEKCPACQNTITDKITECPNCGLNLVA